MGLTRHRDRTGGTIPSGRSKIHVGENVLHLLAWREIAPTIKRPLRRLWGESAAWSVDCTGRRREVTDARLGLIFWLEAESLRHCTAKYCPLQPPPRSTIAAAFSPDGNTLASTHGDHTVKIICCRTGQCLRVLSGHRRTPWVVRFHPRSSDVLASGSLDNEVRLWDANSAECVSSRDFYRPIASLAFHAQGDLLAVASGHKLYIWQYTKEGDAGHPIIVLRTRRSLRAVHFHPHAAPLLLTAEVNDLNSPDCPMTIATSRGYLHYPPPTIHFASSASGPNATSSNTQPAAMSIPSWLWPGLSNGMPNEGIQQEVSMAAADAHGEELFNAVNDLIRDASAQLQPRDNSTEVPMDISPRTSDVELALPATANEVEMIGVDSTLLMSGLANLEDLGDDVLSRAQEVLSRAREGQELAGDPGRSSPTVVGAPWDAAGPLVLPPPATQTEELGVGPIASSGISIIPVARRQVEAGGAGPGPGIWPVNAFANLAPQGATGVAPLPQLQQFLPVGDYAGWELPFLQGWVQGQAQAGLGQAGLAAVGGLPGSLPVPGELRVTQPQQQQLATVAMAAAMTAARAAARNMVAAAGAGLSANGLIAGALPTGVGAGIRTTANQGNPGRGNMPPLGVAEAAAAQAAALTAAAAAELPCTVKLRIWPHDIKRPSALLDPETCRLTIPHAVLCSEMGAHFSPCGRFLAACVACVLPLMEPEIQTRGSAVGSPGGASAVQSPTQHPVPAQQVIYELRVYSLEETTFGQVLASRAVRAAHCLTSIQFSPTSAHILLAYGRRHNSLLRSLVVDERSTIPIYTILEVYRVSDMELVRVLPSAEDEVNVACFHPRVGGGLVYGTKEGKLRILRHDRTPRHPEARKGFEDELLEAETSDPLSFGMVPEYDGSPH